VIRAPALFKDEINAVPTRPEEPLTKMRDIDRLPTAVNVADSTGGRSFSVSVNLSNFLIGQSGVNL
jgi:hypothetical protein